jgi:hypothetical protein
MFSSLLQITHRSPLYLLLQYVNKAASTVRGALKEPAKRKAMAQEAYAFKTALWEGGTQGPKVQMGENTKLAKKK